MGIQHQTVQFEGIDGLGYPSSAEWEKHWLHRATGSEKELLGEQKWQKWNSAHIGTGWDAQI